MSNIIFITGMSGLGKSTTSRRVAEHFPQSMHIDVDQLRQMMVTGRAKPASRPDVVPEEWVKQLQLARSTATFMANLYVEICILKEENFACTIINRHKKA